MNTILKLILGILCDTPFIIYNNYYCCNVVESIIDCYNVILELIIDRALRVELTYKKII